MADHAPDVKIQRPPCPLCEDYLITDDDGDLACQRCRAFWDPETGSFGGWLDDDRTQCHSQVYERAMYSCGPDDHTERIVRCAREDGHPVNLITQHHIGVAPNGNTYCWPNPWLADAPDAVDEAVTRD